MGLVLAVLPPFFGGRLTAKKEGVMSNDTEENRAAYQRALAAKKASQNAFYELCQRAEQGDPDAIEALKNRRPTFGAVLGRLAKEKGIIIE